MLVGLWSDSNENTVTPNSQSNKLMWLLNPYISRIPSRFCVSHTMFTSCVLKHIHVYVGPICSVQCTSLTSPVGAVMRWRLTSCPSCSKSSFIMVMNVSNCLWPEEFANAVSMCPTVVTFWLDNEPPKASSAMRSCMKWKTHVVITPWKLRMWNRCWNCT